MCALHWKLCRPGWPTPTHTDLYYARAPVRTRRENVAGTGPTTHAMNGGTHLMATPTTRYIHGEPWVRAYTCGHEHLFYPQSPVGAARVALGKCLPCGPRQVAPACERGPIKPPAGHNSPQAPPTLPRSTRASA